MSSSVSGHLWSVSLPSFSLLLPLPSAIGNDLTDEAIPDIINFLQSCPTLQSLSLDDSDFTIEGCRQLGRALKSHAPALQTLSIGTSQLTAGCVLFLARFPRLPFPSPSYLTLSPTEVSLKSLRLKLYLLMEIKFVPMELK
jgi:Ran GTPase-activating protein (RanGAP) involved in mRNA processing and transport